MKSQEAKSAKTGTNKRVFVGMSGGVDSSVSAALLKQQGYDVTGVFIKVWQPDWLECTWRDERRDAMRVSACLEIPFITLDLENEYKKEVVDYMISEYKAGRTPNPDVMCNRHVKFGAFYDWAIKQGADFVATGHYAQIKSNPNSSASHNTIEATHYSLVAGLDKNKDQSYFLWTLRNDQLSKVIFPIGNLTKPQVRNLARKFKLPTSEKKDSQGLCFIGMVDMKEFLSHYIEIKKGDVLDLSGNIIGSHDGAFLYTIGERHGFTITKKSPNDEASYVISKNIEANTITVSNKNPDGMLPNASTKIILRGTNWNQGSIPIGKKLSARSRYREQLQDVIMANENNVEFLIPQDTLSSGQSLVIYDGEVCLGGGIII
jgi:tRNA-uridine 2-sulfurtransferase